MAGWVRSTARSTPDANRVVALKVLLPELARDEHYRERFRRESDSAARLQDPHVIPIHDFGEIDGLLYIDMRLVDGVGLDQVLAGGPLDPHRAVALVTQVAEALADAHAHGVVHRDVKPSNILVTGSDFVYLVDFGIARSTDGDGALTRTGQAIGTLGYMAPERFDGGAPDSRSDIYGLACILAECLLGRLPFPGYSLPTLMKGHLLSEPPRPSTVRPDVPVALDDVIRRGMAKDPDRRFQRADELATAAQAALREPTWADRAPWPSRPLAPTAMLEHAAAHPVPVESARRRGGTGRAVAAVALVVGLVCAGVGFGLGRATAPEATAPATADAGSSQPDPAGPGTGGEILVPGPGPVSGSGTRPSHYTYTVESNYPVFLTYTDGAGDSVQEQSVATPWTKEISTDAWGADARPNLIASSSSSKGDTTLTCKIIDDQGQVVASNTKATAFAGVICLTFN